MKRFLTPFAGVVLGITAAICFAQMPGYAPKLEWCPGGQCVGQVQSPSLSITAGGALATPQISLATQTNSGLLLAATVTGLVSQGGYTFYNIGTTNYLGRSLDANGMGIFSSAGGLSLGATCSIGTASTDVCTRGSIYLSSAKGAALGLKQNTISVTFPGGGSATQVTSGLIPAGAFLVGVTARVTTTGTSIQIGDGSTADQWCPSGTAITQNTTCGIPKSATSYGPLAAAREATVTSVGSNCQNLVVAITATYLLATAATSN